MRKPAEFRRVFADARRSSRGPFTVLARPNGGHPARLGLAIAKRSARRAVDRNRIKRVVRDSFRHNRRTLHGLDLVVLSRPGITRLSRPALRELIEAHWSRLRERHPLDHPED